jgi:hypothetical protein
VLATVVPTGHPTDGPGSRAGAHREAPPAPVLDSCGFRMSVARAWCDHQEGQRVALAGQVVDDLSVEWTIAPPGQMLGFGGMRTQCGGHLVWALPSLLTPDALTEVLEQVDDPDELTAAGAAPSVLAAVEARLVRDDLLGVSVVHIEVRPDQLTGAPPRLVPMLDEVTRRLVAASAAAELMQSVATLPR